MLSVFVHYPSLNARLAFRLSLIVNVARLVPLARCRPVSERTKTSSRICRASCSFIAFARSCSYCVQSTCTLRKSLSTVHRRVAPPFVVHGDCARYQSQVFAFPAFAVCARCFVRPLGVGKRGSRECGLVGRTRIPLSTFAECLKR